MAHTYALPALFRRLLAVAVLAVVLGATAAQAQRNVDQNDPGCSDATGAPYCTIQAAVDDALPGETVLVADGTYNENVTVNKNLSLLSENGRASTTIEGISGAGALGTVRVTNATTAFALGDVGQGFTVIGIDNGSPGVENAAVYFQGGHSGATIRDNEIRANGDGGLLTEFAAVVTGFTIDGNTFSGQTFTGATPGGCGFGSQFTAPNVPRQLVAMGGGSGGGNTSNVTFTDNQITGTAGGPSTASGCETTGQGNTLVTIDANVADISGNTFSGTTARFATSLRARGPATTIQTNTFDSSGLLYPPANGHVFIQNTGQTTGGVAAANTFDKGVYVDATTGTIGLSVESFAESSAVPAGSTINVLPGTYVESGQIRISKNLTIAGADQATTIIQPGSDTGTSGDPRGFFLVDGGVTFDVRDLTIDGTGRRVWQAIRNKGSGSVTDVTFNQIRYQTSGAPYQGTAVAAFGDGPVDVTGSTFTQIGRIGAQFFGSGAAGSTFSGNTYTGKGPGDWLDYALDIGAGATVTVEENSVSGNRGVASSDGSTSAAVLVTTFFGGGTQATVRLNDLTDNTTGIAVGFNGDDTSTVTAEQNNITGNDFGVFSTAPTVAASCNWWGDPSGPGGAGPGSGDPVDAQTDFTPWLFSPAPSTCSPPPVACTTASPVSFDFNGDDAPSPRGDGDVTALDFDARGLNPVFGEFAGLRNESANNSVDLDGCAFVVFDPFDEDVTYADNIGSFTAVAPGDSLVFATQNGDRTLPANTLTDGPGAFALVTGTAAVGDDVMDFVDANGQSRVVAAVVYDETGAVYGATQGGATQAQLNAFLQALAEVFGGATAGEDGGDIDLTVGVWPNPSSGRARVAFGVAEPGDVRVTVYDALGREVAVLADGPHRAGRHAAAVEAGALAPGAYVVRVASDGGIQTARLTIAR